MNKKAKVRLIIAVFVVIAAIIIVGAVSNKLPLINETGKMDALQGMKMEELVAAGNMIPVGELVQGMLVEASFCPVTDTISGADVRIATYARENSCNVTVRILDSGRNVLVERTYYASRLKDNSVLSIEFEEISCKPGDTMYFQVLSENGEIGNAITLFQTGANVYNQGSLAVNGKEQPADLIFSVKTNGVNGNTLIVLLCLLFVACGVEIYTVLRKVSGKTLAIQLAAAVLAFVCLINIYASRTSHVIPQEVIPEEMARDSVVLKNEFQGLSGLVLYFTEALNTEREITVRVSGTEGSLVESVFCKAGADIACVELPKGNYEEITITNIQGMEIEAVESIEWGEEAQVLNLFSVILFGLVLICIADRGKRLAVIMLAKIKAKGVSDFPVQWLGKHMEVLGFAAVLLIGTYIICAFPDDRWTVSWDEQVHYMRAVHLSHVLDGYDLYSEYDLYYRENANYQQVLDFYYEQQVSGNSTADNPGMANIAYIPSAIGLFMGRLMGMSRWMTYMMGRWCNLWFYALITYLSVRKIKYDKIIPLVYALLPTNLFLACSYTYDTWLTGVLMLGICWFYGEWKDGQKEMELKAQIMIPIVLCVAVLPKTIYSVIAVMAFFMPKEKFKERFAYYRYKAFILLSVVFPYILGVLPKLINPGTGDLRGGSDVNSAEQIQYILNNIPEFAGNFIGFLVEYLNPFVTGEAYIANYAYLGNPGNDSAILCLVIAAAILCKTRDEVKVLPWWYKLGSLAMYIGVGALCAGSMYILFTPVGAATIAGCQGRYLLPVLFPVIYGIFDIKTERKYVNEKMYWGISCGVVLLMCIANIYSVYSIGLS